MKLENDGFVLVGRVTLEPPSTFSLHFDRSEHQDWQHVIYAFRIGGEVVRIGKTESALCKRMSQWQKDVSRALAGEFHKGGTNPWEAFEWRKRLTEHGRCDFLVRPPDESQGTRRERELIKKYDPALCNDSPCARRRPQVERSVKDVAAAKAYWQQLNNSAIDWTLEERALLREETEDACLSGLIQEETLRQKSRSYQRRQRLAVIEKLGGKCVECGEDNPAVLQIDEHDKNLTWSPRYKAILDGSVRPKLLCATCNWKKRVDLNEATGRPRHR